MAMNAAEELSRQIRETLVDASVEIDAPTHGSGYWWIDARRGNLKAAIEWRPNQGFGVGFGAGGYGEGPDIVVSSVEEAAERVLQFLRSDDEDQTSDRETLAAASR